MLLLLKFQSLIIKSYKFYKKLNLKLALPNLLTQFFKVNLNFTLVYLFLSVSLLFHRAWLLLSHHMYVDFLAKNWKTTSAFEVAAKKIVRRWNAFSISGYDSLSRPKTANSSLVCPSLISFQLDILALTTNNFVRLYFFHLIRDRVCIRFFVNPVNVRVILRSLGKKERYFFLSLMIVGDSR